jgi:hypothetical protein
MNKLKDLARQQQLNVETMVCDLNDFRIEAKTWDGIVSIWCHVPPTLRKKLHASAVQGLKPQGVLILEAYHPRQLNYKTGGPPLAELMMTQHELSEELNGLEFKVLQEIDRVIREGKGHNGLSAVTQCVGIKP